MTQDALSGTRADLDEERIMRILGKVGQVWSQLPDMRLGQLIVNLLPHRLGNDAFYFEDENLEKCLDIVLEEGFASYAAMVAQVAEDSA